MEDIDQLNEILSCYKILIQSDLEAYSNKKSKMRIPIMPVSLLKFLIEESTRIFTEEPTMLEIHAPICVVGDIHGQIIDILRILKECDLPPNRRYLFLGDFIDRGFFSSETLIIVLVLKVLFPRDVYIIRGNHEFEPIFDHSSFFSEITSLYGDDTIINLFMNCFSYMPLAANVDNFILCLHGGISEGLIFIDQLKSIKRPIVDFQDTLVSEILWSDPIDEPNVDYQDSPRGLGRLFGLRPVNNFLQRNGFSYIVRGHQCKPGGCESNCNRKVITVFSASNYCGIEDNKSGVLFILPSEMYETKLFPPFKQIVRNEASFVPMDMYKNSPRKKKSNETNSPTNNAEDNNNNNAIEEQKVSKQNPFDAFNTPTSERRKLVKMTDAQVAISSLPRFNFQISSPYQRRNSNFQARSQLPQPTQPTQPPQPQPQTQRQQQSQQVASPVSNSRFDKTKNARRHSLFPGPRNVDRGVSVNKPDSKLTPQSPRRTPTVFNPSNASNNSNSRGRYQAPTSGRRMSLGARFPPRDP